MNPPGSPHSLLVVHPTGNTYVRNDLRALEEHGMLERYFTGLGFARDGAIARLAEKFSLGGELKRRAYDLPASAMSARPLRETMRLLSSRLGWRDLVRHEHGWASVDAVFRDLDGAASQWMERTAATSGKNGRPDSVLAYEDGAEHTLAAARKIGWRGFYHLPIAYGPFARKIFAEEAQRLPEWAPTLQGDRDSPEKLARKEREAALADVILCPSRFVLESLPENIRREKSCFVIPYGAPESLPSREPDSRDKNVQRPLRLLFVGALSQRKGLADIFAAWKQLPRPEAVELVLLGRPCASWEFYRGQGVPFTYEEPRANEGVLELMRTCDALVLPSLVEGRAIVQLEALSCGLPLLVTPHCGGEDLVTPGETGFMLPIRNPAALAEKISWLLDNRSRLPQMRAACREKAAGITWADYRRRLATVLAGANGQVALSAKIV